MEDLIAMMMGWRHSEFNVYSGPRVQPGDERAMENLARYIIRASFSQERMTYIPEESKVSYQSKDTKDEKVFNALEWLAAMCSHVPNKGEQMVRYYGCYSNVLRGKRQKENQDGHIPYILEQEGSKKEYGKNWTRLIQKIYEVDPLKCLKCSGKMKIISIIEDEEVIKKILQRRTSPQTSWIVRREGQTSAQANGPPEPPKYYIDYTDSQLPVSDNWLDVDPEYP